MAVSFANGSNMPLARVDGDADFRRLIHWMALEPDVWDIPEPTTTPKLILHDMIKCLVDQGTQSLGRSILAAVASLPAKIASVAASASRWRTLCAMRSPEPA